MTTPIIIGLSGPAGSGKDTIADLLVAHAGFTKIAFADPLRSEVTAAFGIDPSILSQRETKELPLHCLALSRCHDDGFVTRMRAMPCWWLAFDLQAPRSPRWTMQRWGTDYRRNQRQDYWTNLTRERIKSLLTNELVRRFVIADVRFGDEAELVRRFGGQVWQITREDMEAIDSGHISEVSGSEFAPDVVVNNSDTLKHLQARVLEALEASYPTSQRAAA